MHLSLVRSEVDVVAVGRQLYVQHEDWVHARAHTGVNFVEHLAPTTNGLNGSDLAPTTTASMAQT